MGCFWSSGCCWEEVRAPYPTMTPERNAPNTRRMDDLSILVLDQWKWKEKEKGEGGGREEGLCSPWKGGVWGGWDIV